VNWKYTLQFESQDTRHWNLTRKTPVKGFLLLRTGT